MENVKSNNLLKEFDEEELKKYSKIPDAAFTDLKNLMERINIMTEKEVIDRLKRFHLDAQGSDSVLRKRLKDSYKKVILASVDLCLSTALLPYYVIIDFEATCEEVNPPDFRHEIIEFPAVIVDSKRQEIIDCFQMYCKPQINPKISEFCTKLTGITQEQVDSAETFDKVLVHFQNWLAQYKLGKKYKYAVVTDGPWDMSRFLYSQCHYSNIKFPKWGNEWVNLRKAFSKFYQCERICLKNMLKFLELDFIGRPHCGLDDAKNIARIFLKMIYDGANIQINERVTKSKKQKEKIKLGNGNTEVSNSVSGIDNKTEKLKVEAHYAAVHYIDKMPVYKKMKRDRSIGEVQIARKILKSPTSMGKPNSESKINANQKHARHC